MNELHLHDRFLLPFLRDSLGYREVKASTRFTLLNPLN
ncbi:hypothetical protein EDE11_1575 [Methylomonas methanica]|uniref:Uncharacterized protein n=1 Tax=Methylomonas methanica TaxID=421 RepID=A0ABY2CF50_METMH|nr:hypothetical protein EDE11_1575 [Methylomonas methanica]